MTQLMSPRKGLQEQAAQGCTAHPQLWGTSLAGPDRASPEGSLVTCRDSALSAAGDVTNSHQEPREPKETKLERPSDPARGQPATSTRLLIHVPSPVPQGSLCPQML